MKKLLPVILIFCALIVVLWVAGRLTNAFQFFKAPTGSNHPTIKGGDHFFASNLKKPKRFDFICYNVEIPEEGRFIYAHRLCGYEGDKIEIKAGKLFINDSSADDDLDLMHSFTIPAAELELVPESERLMDATICYNNTGDSVTLFLPGKLVAEKKLHASRVILPAGYRNEEIAAAFGAQWNQDHFGPLIVPKGKYFVLGDNRLLTRDSRYLGFVDRSDFVATVLGRR